MVQIYGDYRDNLPDSHEFLILGFSPSAIPIQQRWRNNGISADFIADYLATFLPVRDDDPGSPQKRAEIKGAVSYIANELLENAMKFNAEESRQPIRFGMHLIEDERTTLILLTINCISETTLTKFKTFVEEFLSGDSDELYLRQLERSAEDGEENTSGLGLLTMKNDYQAKLGWKIEPERRDDAIATLTTMVQVEI